MHIDWEYKVLTLKDDAGGFKLGQTPTDDRITSALNREGAAGWDLVNAVCAGPMHPITLFMKRPR
jgi:hypothetical protein